MKRTLALAIVFVLSLYSARAQVVSNPLRDYYIRNFSKIDFTTAPDPEGPHPITPQTLVSYFKADFTGDGRKSVFITCDGDGLGPHGDYAWEVYYPLATGGYRLLTDPTHFFDFGGKGPDYIGYIDQLKRYGVITAPEGGKYGISAQYLENGSIHRQTIDEERDHADSEHYPKYFPADFPDYGIQTCTVAQLIQKYAKPDPKNVISPAAKSEASGS